MHSYRVKVFHAAYYDAVVTAVSDDFILDLLPACNRLFEQDLTDRAVFHSLDAEELQLLLVFRDTAACSAKRVRRSYDNRKAFFFNEIIAFIHRCRDDAARYRFSYILHQRLEFFSVFCSFDAFFIYTQQSHAVLFEDALAFQLHSQVQPCLSAESCQYAVRSLLCKDLFESFFSERLHVDLVCDPLVCHDRCRVAVYQYSLYAFFPDGLACLSSRIVEFRSLSYNDRAGTDDKYFFQIWLLRH